MRQYVGSYACASDQVRVESAVDATDIVVGRYAADGIGHPLLVVTGLPAERRDFLARLILAAQAEVDRLDVAAAEPNGRAVAS